MCRELTWVSPQHFGEDVCGLSEGTSLDGTEGQRLQLIIVHHPKAILPKGRGQ